MRPLTLSETFGPTFQGEGPSAGRRAAFVRLGLCNLDCAWCDTPYTWDWLGKNGPKQDRSALVQRSPSNVFVELIELDVPLVVITGGEPMLQQGALAPLVAALVGGGMDVEIETNGTIAAKDAMRELPIGWNVSPKLRSSGVDPGRAITPAVLSDFAELGARWKLVAADAADLVHADRLVAALSLDPSSVWVMPEGRSAEAIVAGMRQLAEPVLARGWNLSGRQHVLLWGDERGR